MAEVPPAAPELCQHRAHMGPVVTEVRTGRRRLSRQQVMCRGRVIDVRKRHRTDDRQLVRAMVRSDTMFYVPAGHCRGGSESVECSVPQP